MSLRYLRNRARYASSRGLRNKCPPLPSNHQQARASQHGECTVCFTLLDVRSLLLLEASHFGPLKSRGQDKIPGVGGWERKKESQSLDPKWLRTSDGSQHTLLPRSHLLHPQLAGTCVLQQVPTAPQQPPTSPSIPARRVHGLFYTFGRKVAPLARGVSFRTPEIKRAGQDPT